MADERPAWMRPPQYTDEPESPRPGANEDEDPIDYSRGPDRGIVFGEDEEDDAPPEDDA